MALHLLSSYGLLKTAPNFTLAHLLNALAADLIHLLALLKADDF